MKSTHPRARGPDGPPGPSDAGRGPPSRDLDRGRLSATGRIVQRSRPPPAADGIVRVCPHPAALVSLGSPDTTSALPGRRSLQPARAQEHGRVPDTRAGASPCRGISWPPGQRRRGPCDVQVPCIAQCQHRRSPATGWRPPGCPDCPRSSTRAQWLCPRVPTPSALAPPCAEPALHGRAGGWRQPLSARPRPGIGQRLHAQPRRAAGRPPVLHQHHCAHRCEVRIAEPQHRAPPVHTELHQSFTSHLAPARMLCTTLAGPQFDQPPVPHPGRS